LLGRWRCSAATGSIRSICDDHAGARSAATSTILHG